MMSPEQIKRMLYLFGVLREETITPQEISELNEILETQPQAREYYIDYVFLCTDLCNLQAATSHNSIFWDVLEVSEQESREKLQKASDLFETMRMLGEDEKIAEAVAIPLKGKRIEENGIINIPVQTLPRRINKASLYTAFLSLAALVMMFGYVYLNPKTSVEVATVIDSLGADWTGGISLDKGVRLHSETPPIKLTKGVVELVTEEEVRIVIEAPADFRFISSSQMILNYGRLYSTVSETGRGFTVQSPLSKVIDLGTEFGVFADMQGKTELHVFKGNTMLIAGQKGQTKKTIEVFGGQAFRVDSYNSNVTEIHLKPNLFARGIDSRAGLIITGGKQIDLADIVGGGDGSGSGKKNQGVRWDGTKAADADMVQKPDGTFPTGYVAVNDNPYIDGIFVPNCKGQEARILSSTAADLNFDDFVAADTNGQLTLILLKETDDPSATYYFYPKETVTGDPSKYPTLIFPKASAAGPVRITTANGNGADTYVSNDILRAPTIALGKRPTMVCRYYKDVRCHIIYLRFDISKIKANNLTDAVLSMCLDFGNRDRNLQIYGLKDGPADFWNEAAINYNNAPGLQPAAYGNYQLSPDAVIRLGTLPVTDNRISSSPIRITADNKYRWGAPSSQCGSYSIISNTDRYVAADGTSGEFMLDNLRCGTEENPSIFMHANAGITFNLDAIRRDCGPVSIESFTASCGIAKPAAAGLNNQDYAAANLYVLVDGQEVFGVIDMSPEDGAQKIKIPLDRQAHYLTLVTTQGTDNSIADDKCLFVKPLLNLK